MLEGKTEWVSVYGGGAYRQGVQIVRRGSDQMPTPDW